MAHALRLVFPAWGWLALAGVTLVRLAVAAALPLSPDEAYYWVFSRALAPGYLDHPPMVALWIRAGTWIAGDGATGVRLLAPFSAGIGSVLLADAAERLLPGRQAGFRAAMLLNATLLLGVGAVTMTPDTPLIFFWTATLWALARVTTGGGKWFVVAGAMLGFALVSKYTAVFAGLGAGLWLMLTPAMRPWLSRPAPWIGAVLAGIIFAPVVWWNAEHGWASFLKQGGRAGDLSPGRAIRFVAELIGSQVGLATPLVFLFLAMGAGLAVRLAWRTRDPAWTLLAAMTWPAALLFAEHTLGDRVQGNWPAILYPTVAIAAAGLDGAFWRRLFCPALALGFSITAIVYLQGVLGLFPIPPKLDPTALQLAGWQDFSSMVESARQREGASFIAADQYGVASQLAHLIPAPVIGIEPRWRFFDLPQARIAGKTGILVRSLRRGSNVDTAPWSEIRDVGTAFRQRDGVAVEGYRLYSVVGAADTPQAVELPMPNKGEPR